METNVMAFLDCPARMAAHGLTRRGLPLKFQARSLARSTLPG